MNKEQTHYRTIPEAEYQELKALAEGNEMAIRKIMSDSLFYKELDTLKEQMRETKLDIRMWMYWFDDIIEELKKADNFMTSYRVSQLIKLKEKL